MTTLRPAPVNGKQLHTAACQINRVLLARLGDKWTMLVLISLSAGTRRFSELQREVEGVSQRMLTQTLRELEALGLVSRRIFPTIPPKVEYTLTPVGQSLLGPLGAFYEWVADHQAELLEAQGLREAVAGEQRELAG